MAPAKRSRALRYYKLGETPAYYITAWYNLLSGKWEFGKVHATGRVYNTTLGMWNWFTPNPDAPLVLAWLACNTYPDAFADYPLGDTIKEYYKTWYGYDVTDDELEEMLLY